MDETDILKKLKKCKVDLTPGSNWSWELRIKEVDPVCREALQDICKITGPESKKMLSRRLIPETPQAKKILKEIGLES
jgi:hypothetical protein